MVNEIINKIEIDDKDVIANTSSKENIKDKLFRILTKKNLKIFSLFVICIFALIIFLQQSIQNSYCKSNTFKLKKTDIISKYF